MDLTTTYLGLKLRTPLVCSASPLSETLDAVKKMEDAGASAVVLSSLFEEQLTQDRDQLIKHLTEHTNTFAEAQTFFPAVRDFHWGPEDYLNHIRKAKKAVKIPIIGSLNGTSLGGWTSYAKEIQKAGADAIELNIYSIPTNPSVSGAEVEQTHIEILKAVRKAVSIPVAVKIGPSSATWPAWPERSTTPGRGRWCCSTVFISPTSTWTSSGSAEPAAQHAPGPAPAAALDRRAARAHQGGHRRDERRARRQRRAEALDGRRERHDALLGPL